MYPLPMCRRSAWHRQDAQGEARRTRSRWRATARGTTTSTTISGNQTERGIWGTKEMLTCSAEQVVTRPGPPLQCCVYLANHRAAAPVKRPPGNRNVPASLLLKLQVGDDHSM